MGDNVCPLLVVLYFLGLIAIPYILLLAIELNWIFV